MPAGERRELLDHLNLPPGGARSKVSKESLLQAWGTSTTKVKSSGDYDPIGRWPDLASIEKVLDAQRERSIDLQVISSPKNGTRSSRPHLLRRPRYLAADFGDVRSHSPARAADERREGGSRVSKGRLKKGV
jgi:hypothetical protein